jgi:hypothetical protein
MRIFFVSVSRANDAFSRERKFSKNRFFSLFLFSVLMNHDKNKFRRGFADDAEK